MTIDNRFCRHMAQVLVLLAACGALSSGMALLQGQEIKLATFNVSLFRDKPGQLADELATGKSANARKIAEIIQTVRPDILLLNEFDTAQKIGDQPERTKSDRAVDLFRELYLEVSQNGKKPLRLRHQFVPLVNTGVNSHFDLDQDGTKDGPGDAWGYGRFPGQYGLVVLSRYPIDLKRTRTFQNFLWKDMPRARIPKTLSGKPFYPDPIWKSFRLSSKCHSDVVIRIENRDLHFLVSHPTPPVFDGPEDRNGNRNHDEIRFWSDYVWPGKSEYIYDDRNKFGGLKKDDLFVLAGDLNADPQDGDSTGNPIGLLSGNPQVNFLVRPASEGGKVAGKKGAANRKHHGEAALDTADFDDERVGNLRIDYLLPAKSLLVKETGVFWPGPKEEEAKLIEASDHRLVWLKIQLK